MQTQKISEEECKKKYIGQAEFIMHFSFQFKTIP